MINLEDKTSRDSSHLPVDETFLYVSLLYYFSVRGTYSVTLMAGLPRGAPIVPNSLDLVI